MMKTIWGILALVLAVAPAVAQQPAPEVQASGYVGAGVSEAHAWDHRIEKLALMPAGDGVQARGRAYAPDRSGVVRAVARACPGLILQDHAFTDAVASLLRVEFPAENWGRNGKRGNANDPSHDALFMPTASSPFGGAVIDIIAAAGSRDAAPAWIDQTDATIAAGTTGVWVRPSGVLPACLSGAAPGPGPTPDPPKPTLPPATDFTEVLVALSRIEDRLAALESREPAGGSVAGYVDDMIGKGPGDRHPDIPNHITDLKLRLDVLRVQLEQLDAWLRGRRVLRY